jgi:hypothetical protein
MIVEDKVLTRHLTKDWQTVPMLAGKLKRAGRTLVTPGNVRDWYDRQVRGGFAEWTDDVPTSANAATYSFMHGYRLITPSAVLAWPQAQRRAEELRANGEPDRADAVIAIAWERMRAAKKGEELTPEQEADHAWLEEEYAL